ncbi:MAG: hypothetical protein QOJ83_248, partial [Frankiales bacterium]|nr:hypothetical protein [Frankiales bacterium]
RRTGNAAWGSPPAPLLVDLENVPGLTHVDLQELERIQQQIESDTRLGLFLELDRATHLLR